MGKKDSCGNQQISQHFVEHRERGERWKEKENAGKVGISDGFAY